MTTVYRCLLSYEFDASVENLCVSINPVENVFDKNNDLFRMIFAPLLQKIPYLPHQPITKLLHQAF